MRNNGNAYCRKMPRRSLIGRATRRQLSRTSPTTQLKARNKLAERLHPRGSCPSYQNVNMPAQGIWSVDWGWILVERLEKLALNIHRRITMNPRIQSQPEQVLALCQMLHIYNNTLRVKASELQLGARSFKTVSEVLRA